MLHLEHSHNSAPSHSSVTMDQRLNNNRILNSFRSPNPMPADEQQSQAGRASVASHLPQLQPLTSLTSVQPNQGNEHTYRDTAAYLPPLQNEPFQPFFLPQARGQYPSSSMAVLESFQNNTPKAQKIRQNVQQSKTSSSSMEEATESLNHGGSSLQNSSKRPDEQRMYRGKPCYSAEEKKKVRAIQNRAAMKRSREKKKLEDSWKREELDLLRRQVVLLGNQREEMMRLLEDAQIMTRDAMIEKWPPVESKQVEKVKIRSIID